MYPPRFDYSAPATLPEALSELARLGEDGRVLAGGQSLIPMMKLRVAAPAHLVDINRLSELSYIRRENGHLAIGALARHADIVDSPLVPEASKVMADAAPWIADPLVRNRGTLCGSVAHCDPEGDWNSVMLAVGASVIAVSESGERTIPISEFVVDFFTNSLEPGEMVKEVRVPVPKGCQRRRLHQARTQDRRLRHGRSSHPPRTRRLGKDQRGRNRLDVGPHLQHEGLSGRVDPDGSNARPMSSSPKPPRRPPEDAPRTRTSGGRPSSSRP